MSRCRHIQRAAEGQSSRCHADGGTYSRTSQHDDLRARYVGVRDGERAREDSRRRRQEVDVDTATSSGVQRGTAVIRVREVRAPGNAADRDRRRANVRQRHCLVCAPGSDELVAEQQRGRAQAEVAHEFSGRSGCTREEVSVPRVGGGQSPRSSSCERKRAPSAARSQCRAAGLIGAGPDRDGSARRARKLRGDAEADCYNLAYDGRARHVRRDHRGRGRLTDVHDSVRVGDQVVRAGRTGAHARVRACRADGRGRCGAGRGSG